MTLPIWTVTFLCVFPMITGAALGWSMARLRKAERKILELKKRMNALYGVQGGRSPRIIEAITRRHL